MAPERALYLVRHGVTAWNLSGRFSGQRDIPLTPEGESQARAIGLALKDRIGHLAAIFASDLRRARATANLMAVACGLDPVIRTSPKWREASFGEWEGLSWGEIETAYPESARRWSDDYVRCAPPGGESLEELATRGGAAIVETIGDGHLSEGPIVVVTHGGMIRAVLARFALGDLRRFWDVDVPPGSAVVASPVIEPSGPGGALRLRILSQIIP
ncbi:MAG: histidine phosphatase family protein [Bacillota bacterium]